jgi:hypothetical protein
MEETGEQRAKCDPNGRTKPGGEWKDYILGAEPPGETLDPGLFRATTGGHGSPESRPIGSGSGRGRGKKGGAGRVDRLAGLKLHLDGRGSRPFRGNDP